MKQAHNTLDMLEAAIDEAIEQTKNERDRTLDRLRSLKSRVAAARVSMIAGRGDIVEINPFKGVA
jgi:outer membrane protein TolC